MEIEQLKGFIVKKLFHHGYMGGRHTAIEHLSKGLPKHIGTDIRDAVNSLLHEEIIVIKVTGYGTHVSLNQRKIHEIMKYIE